MQFLTITTKKTQKTLQELKKKTHKIVKDEYIQSKESLAGIKSSLDGKERRQMEEGG